MTIYFSKSTNGFYDTSLNNYALPDDVVEITDEKRQSLLSDERNGLEISSDSDGNPITQEKTLTDEEKKQNLIFLAKKALAESDLVSIRCVKAGIQYPSSWLSRDKSLREIVNGTDTTSTSLPDLPDYPEGT